MKQDKRQVPSMSHQQTFAPEYRPRSGSAKRRARRPWQLEYRFGRWDWNITGRYETLDQALMAQRATTRGYGSRLPGYQSRIIGPDGEVSTQGAGA